VSDPVVTVTGLDHLVLRVADVERSLAFYLDTLGMAPVRVDEWRAGEVLFPSVRVDERTIIDVLAAAPDDPAGRNVDHFCLVVEPTDLHGLADSGSVDVVGGPANLFGARGQGEALYVRDPDGNVLELRYYP
jgi:catechol 2,3-dioxygenase-like lactoylglutathione lyase family enzyme